MNARHPPAEAIFAAVIEMADPVARRACLEGACAGDEALRREVESLLAAHDAAGGFMDTGARPNPRLEAAAEKPGDRIGRYKLLEPIGEGDLAWCGWPNGRNRCGVGWR